MRSTSQPPAWRGARRPSRARRWAIAGVALASVATAACGSGGAGKGGTAGTHASANSQSQAPRRGGTLTYLVNGVLASWTEGLDPASAGLASVLPQDAIFGNLFQAGPNGKVEPVLAQGYRRSNDGRTLTITLRAGVRFTDGTPLNAEAVAWNIRRDLATPCSCSPSASWPPLTKTNGITTPDEHTVVLHFTRPYAPAIYAIINSSVNYVASPTAYRTMGAKRFKLQPVGAGPFQVTQNRVDSRLTLTRNPHYWRKGKPYLQQLAFQVVSDDQTAYQALRAGQGQVTQVTSPAIIQEAQGNESMSVLISKGVQPVVVQLNTSVPPFTSKLAREAIYYATDPKAVAHLYRGLFPVVQSFLGPGGLFYRRTVPDYRTFDLAKAKQIVAQLGGIRVSMMGPTDELSVQTLTALQTEWRKAGIEVTIHPYALNRVIQEFKGKKWQAALMSAGAYDPGVSSGLPFNFASNAEFSGVHDPTLDAMMARANATLDAGTRAGLYASIAKRISDQAYAPFLVAKARTSLAAQGVHGPGLTDDITVTTGFIKPHWDEAWIEEP